MTDIKYKIIYNAAATPPADYQEIDLSMIKVSGTPYDLKTFKEYLKKLLADNSSANVVAFLGEFVKIANAQVTLATPTVPTVPTTFDDVNPFIFAIDTIIDTKIQRTYLHFPDAKVLADLKVNFYQYSVDTTIFTDIKTELSVFNERLITKKYSDYKKLTEAS
jgi:hypothetical protein